MTRLNDIDKHFREALLETVPCAIFMVDINNQIIFWNKSAEELTGYTVDEIVGSTCDKLRMSICISRDPAIMKTLCPLLSGGQGGEVECEIRRKDGSVTPIMRKSRAVFDNKGELIGAIEALVDVTLIKQARAEIRVLKHEIARMGKYGNLIGRSDQMRKLYDMIETVARTDASIVIEGKTGTGKELVAKTIHAESTRSERIFLAVNCGALPESLLEAELFGHKRGAFTGAIEDRAGCFETASNGTLFLDEIGEMSLSSQVKLLRVLQEKQITRVGDSLPRPVDVRIIAASNKNLADMVKSGQFREDLYYRLHVVGLIVPSLLDRKDDIPDLVAHFITQFNEKYSKQIEGCSPKAMDLFLAHSWPGNIRELEHAVEHAFVVTAPGQKVITADSLPPEILHPAEMAVAPKKIDIESIDEKTLITNALAEANGNKSQAARILGITRAGLYKKMHRLGL